MPRSRERKQEKKSNRETKEERKTSGRDSRRETHTKDVGRFCVKGLSVELSVKNQAESVRVFSLRLTESNSVHR